MRVNLPTATCTCTVMCNLHCSIQFTAVCHFIYFFDFMTIKSVLLIHSIFFLSDSDEDPLPPKIRYFDTHTCICNKFVHQFLSMYMLLALEDIIVCHG